MLSTVLILCVVVDIPLCSHLFSSVGESQLLQCSHRIRSVPRVDEQYRQLSGHPSITSTARAITDIK